MSSRLLARTMLFKHLMKIDGLSVHVFKDLEDAGWKRYYVLKKPLFVLANDGGVATDEVAKLESYSAARILNRRLFLFRLLASGISFARLNGAEYRDFKILTFVNEQSRDPHAHRLLPLNFWMAALHSEDELEAAVSDASQRITVSSRLPPESTTEDILFELARTVTRSGHGGRFAAELLFSFLLHCILLPNLTARSRARPNQETSISLSKVVTESFLTTVFLALSKLFTTVHDCIDIDGRIFTSILHFISLSPRGRISDILSASDYSLLDSIWSRLGYSEPDFTLFATHFSLKEEVVPQVAIAKTRSLLPFKNNVFDNIFNEVKVTIQDAEDDRGLFPAKYFARVVVFKDDRHWHNQNPLVIRSSGHSKPKKVGFYARCRELRNHQKFMRRLQLHAATLTGASGAILQQMVIAPVGVCKESHVLKDYAVNTKKGEAKLSSADRLRLKIRAERATKQDNQSQSWWREHLSIMSNMAPSQNAAYIKRLFKNRKSEESSICLEMQLYQLNLEFLQWADDVNRDSDAVRDQRTVVIVRIIKDICDGTPLTPSAAKVLKMALHAIGFGDYIPGMVEKFETAVDKRLSFKPAKLVSSKTKEPYYPYMRISEDPVLWQLRLFGNYMDRSMDGLPDRRVSFVPDAWQRKILDSIDSKHSLLVVAPTSAGKTFISFYAMEKVLRESDDGILVYVAPTKALVTQVAAEVNARFSKSQKNGSCWAIHTRDYRMHNPAHCQILVTVPDILVTMLLSPAIAQSWTPRVKWIILDEIHCIGQQDGSMAIWEQIILFAPCPIIGLSATIGSPETFNSWLETVQEAHGYKHTFVHHPHRYSHLRKFYYLLDVNKTPDHFIGLDDYQPTSNARFLHPISAMSFGNRSLPSDLALEAQDTLSLYQALARHSQSLDYDMSTLEPSRFFAHCKGKLLTQKDIISYEVALKEIVSPIFDSTDPADSTSPIHRILNDLKDPVIAGMSESSLNITPTTAAFFGNLIYLVADLHTRDNLPAILFCFDRTGCERILEVLLETFEKAEGEWRQSSTEYQRKIHAWRAWKAKSKVRERQNERNSKFKRENDLTEREEQETSWKSTFDPDEPMPQFSFANSKVYSKVDLERDITELTGMVQPWVLRALRRGIAVHHAGMNKGYRSLVESLFRQRFVRVLVSTGTLALGINAPTKTCVFVSDSPFLTASTYRQCSGRAGRRGYDLLGNVIFYGLSMDRVQRLMLSKLPTLGSSFPMTSTLALRLCNFLYGSDNATVALDAIRTVTSVPSISFNSEIGRHQLLHHLRFSIEYLRRSHLLDMRGRPINLYALAAHLYFTEPSNFALVTLMHSGVLHNICIQADTAKARRDFIHLMCHLFGRRYISRITLNSESISKLTKRYPSMIVLPPLTENIRDVLTKHDQDVLDIFTTYVITYAKEHHSHMGVDNCLPLSGIRYISASDLANEGPILNQHLEGTALRVSARSVFVANSGHDDQFNNIHELARTVRQGIHLNEHAIPSMTHLLAGGTEEHELNAYLLDFYTHGQTASLIKANGIRPNDIWFFLEDFALTLSAMKAALERLFTASAKLPEYETRTSSRKANSDEDGDADEFETDSGYESLSSNSLNDDEDKEVERAEKYLMKRPMGISDADWKVYEVVSMAREEFMIKFKAMWA
ncbi:hypothetical protein AX15_001928 [Amanita polypyramis BW_CC]|nr:hypothetical protein AX15_001928 [Amanita polypyramis BW_CC]